MITALHAFHRRIVLTGATQGIGEATARRLAPLGAQLFLNARSADKLAQLQAELSTQTQVHIFAGDVSDPNVARALIAEAEKAMGGIDVLINNAGVGPKFGLLQEIPLADLDRTIDVNLKAPLYLMQAAIPGMAHRRAGTIININSIAGKVAYPYSSVYCATKFGLAGLTESIALEQRQNGIRVLGIYPGEVKTPMWDTLEPGVPQDPTIMLDPDDVARAVEYVLLQGENVFLKDITLLPLHAAQH